MSEQDGTEPPMKRRRNRTSTIAIREQGKQVPAAQRPSNGDREAWRVFWKEQGQSWRTEPEIDEERQKYLQERRGIAPDIEQGIYPFKDVQLSRADVEWLLATHENGRGPIDWLDEHQRERLGLDLRGADLRQANLSKLPLSRMRGGLDSDEWLEANEQQLRAAGILLRGASLRWAHLEGSHLRYAHLEDADLFFAHLERSHLRGACLKGVDLRDAYLESTRFQDTILYNEIGVGPNLADAKWGNINLAVVKWSKMEMLGDEYDARQARRDGKLKDKETRLMEYEMAVRANRQLAVVLQAQGLNEDAARFAYRAQKLQRVVWLWQRKSGQYIFSFFLDTLAGYGYKPWRSFIAYLLVITTFAIAYFIIDHVVGPVLSPVGAWIFSMTSFHGRGFFPGGIKLDDPLTILAAIEALVGLLIEVTFIATLTQRLFGK